jgi:hypothetical protein
MSGGIEAPPPQGAQAAMNEQLQSLFSGENLSEEFMGKASVVFESAVNERTEAIRQAMLTEASNLVEQEVGTAVNELATRLDEYLGYAVDEWMKENKLAVESGIRTEISESFITGLKSLFETHYIEVPESKHDILEDLFSENQELENNLNEQIQTNMSFKKEIDRGAARAVFMEAVSDLTQVDAERLAGLEQVAHLSGRIKEEEKIDLLADQCAVGGIGAADRDEGDIIGGHAGLDQHPCCHLFQGGSPCRATDLLALHVAHESRKRLAGIGRIDMVSNDSQTHVGDCATRDDLDLCAVGDRRCHHLSRE